MTTVFLRRLQGHTWMLLILLLPFTSLPVLARAAGLSMVAPPAIVPLFLLGAFWWLPSILRGMKLPSAVIPAIVFACFAIISSATAHFIEIPPFRDSNIFKTNLEALLTLGVGLAFFLLVASWPKAAGELRSIFRWVNFAGLAIIVWSLVQSFLWHTQGGYPDWAYTIQGWISSSGNLYPQRATGFAYEPSWLAHQLNMLFLPYWLAATVQKSSAHPFRLKFITVENLLLLGGVAVLFLSLSRVGWLAFITAVGYLLLRGNIAFVRFVQSKVQNRVSNPRLKQVAAWVLPVTLVIALLVFYAGLLLGAGFVLSRVDYRMAQLFSPTILEQGGFTEIANELVFAERVVFWDTGLEIFNEHPILGVGPGNAGYFFPTKMVPFGWGLTEISTIMYQMSSIPNTKSLWVRLLAETGFVGFSLFVCWLYVLWVNGWSLQSKRDPFFRTVGWMGALALVAFLVEGFSVDTFALPYYWLTFGLVVAACRLATGQPDHHAR